MQIIVNGTEQTDAATGLLIFALRDLGAGLWNIGSGYNVGKGFINVKKITVSHSGQSAILNIAENTIADDNGIINTCMQSLAAVEKGV